MNNDNLYVLDEMGNPRNEPDVHKWGEWFADRDRRIVQQDWLIDEDGDDTKVSTVFTAFDQGDSDPGSPPLLWEPMIFGGEHDEWTARAATREESLVNHRKAMRLAQE